MVPAEECAKSLHLNRKTLQKYYRCIRDAIYLESNRQIRLYFCDAIRSKNKKLRKNPKTKSIYQEKNAICYFSICGNKAFVIDKLLFNEINVVNSKHSGIWAIRLKENMPQIRFKFEYTEMIKIEGTPDKKTNDIKMRRFLNFCKINLPRYKVVENKNLILFLKEMEFRFNDKDGDVGIDFLEKCLEQVADHLI